MCTPRESKRCLGAVGGIPAYGFLLAEEMTEHDGRGERDMNLKSGELYFINEVDVLTGVASNFYKIGLVKDSRQGDAANRLDEHQTGSQISSVDSVLANSAASFRRSLWADCSIERFRATAITAASSSSLRTNHSPRILLVANLL